MNERIKELAVQAIAKYWPNGSADHEKIFENFGKFMEIHAELIIQECVDLVGHFEYAPDGEQGEWANDVIKAHFGLG